MYEILPVLAQYLKKILSQNYTFLPVLAQDKLAIQCK
jgi:hypothetical protein